MLFDGSVHVRVLADDLCGRSDPALLEAVVLCAKATLEREQVQVVVDGLLMLLDSERHVDLVHCLLRVFEEVLRQLIEDAVIRIKYLRTVCICQHLRSHEDALAAKSELVRIAVVLQVYLSQYIHTVGEDTHAHRVGIVFVHIVGDVELVNDELRLVGTSLYSWSQPLEVRDLVPFRLCQFLAGSV